MNKKRMPTSAAGIAGLLGVTGGLAVAATTTTSPKAGYWEQTNSNINMSVTGGKDTTIETLAPPAGSGSCPRTGAWSISDHPTMGAARSETGQRRTSTRIAP